MDTCAPILYVPIDGTTLLPSIGLEMCLPPEGVSDEIPNWFAVENQSVYLYYDCLAKFKISGGRQIEFEAAPDIGEQELQCVLMSAAFGALIHQRGDLPIHGAGLVSPEEDGVTIIVGNCGAGKSTTSAALVTKGWSLIADDICRFSGSTQETGENEIFVHRGYTKIKLTDDACSRLGFDSGVLPRVSKIVDKYFWEPPHIGDLKYKPKRVIILHRPSGTATLEWGQCVNDVAIRALLPHLFRAQIGAAINARNIELLLKQLIEVVSVYVLFIPSGVGPNEVADEITRFVAEGE
jgi:hypothetical protein